MSLSYCIAPRGNIVETIGAVPSGGRSREYVPIRVAQLHDNTSQPRILDIRLTIAEHVLEHPSCHRRDLRLVAEVGIREVLARCQSDRHRIVAGGQVIKSQHVRRVSDINDIVPCWQTGELIEAACVSGPGFNETVGSVNDAVPVPVTMQVHRDPSDASLTAILCRVSVCVVPYPVTDGCISLLVAKVRVLEALIHGHGHRHGVRAAGQHKACRNGVPVHRDFVNFRFQIAELIGAVGTSCDRGFIPIPNPVVIQVEEDDHAGEAGLPFILNPVPVRIIPYGVTDGRRGHISGGDDLIPFGRLRRLTRINGVS